MRSYGDNSAVLALRLEHSLLSGENADRLTPGDEGLLLASSVKYGYAYAGSGLNVSVLDKVQRRRACGQVHHRGCARFILSRTDQTVLQIDGIGDGLEVGFEPDAGRFEA